MTENKFTFVERAEMAHSATWGRRKRQTRVLKGYSVSIGGTSLGTVQERLTSFESRTPGRRWVNYRWESPRWFYNTLAKPGISYRTYYETRQQAAEAMYADVRLSEAQKEVVNG